MYLLQYDQNGELDKITPDPKIGLIGILVDRIPVSIETMLEQGTVIKVEEESQTYYKIIGGNE